MRSSLLLGALASLLLVVEAAPSHAADAERALPGFFSGRFPSSFKNGSATSTPGVQRFVVQYASAQRWKAPVVPQHLKTIKSLPPVCPQPTDEGFTGSEDCLYMVVYAPPRPRRVFVWVHGGSLWAGGANDPMLEGSRLALATNAAVVVVQYRLGVLGFLPPTSGVDSNLGMRDLVAALTVVKRFASEFGLASQQVTVAGQSSGATLVRALLATPLARDLFARAILHSDTADYGFYKPENLARQQKAFFPGKLNCSTTSATCLNNFPLGKLMDMQWDMQVETAEVDPATAGPVPFRPVHDGLCLTTTLTTSFPPADKPLLITTVTDDGGPAIFSPSSGIPANLPAESFAGLLGFIMPNDSRVDKVVESPYYTPLTTREDGVRIALSQFAGDLGFRCADWALARAWAARGGKVYTGVFVRGATHPANDMIDFCKTDGHVCHQDEIPIIFGTARRPSREQRELIVEAQTRIAAFMETDNPNVSRGVQMRLSPGLVRSWSRTANVDAIQAFPLGGTADVPLGACATSFWGSQGVPFDYQLHGL